MLDRLDYYGIAANEDIVDQETSAKALQSLIIPVLEARRKLAEAENNRDAFLLAIESNTQLCQALRTNIDGTLANVKKISAPPAPRGKVLTQKESELFYLYREKHSGLVVGDGTER